MNIFPRLTLAVAITLLMATACQASDDTTTAAAQADVVDDANAEAEPGDAPATASDSASPEAGAGTDTDSVAADQLPAAISPLGEADLSLPPAKGIDELAAASTNQPLPTSVSIDRLDLNNTDVLAVGVEENGEMTVPPPLDVGWYRFGPLPGDAGSAVLAGHIASDGIPGAFRHLDRLEPGDRVTVGFDDGSSQTFVVDELFQVDKTDLPFDSLFARSGPPKLALITCGGEFDYDARSYTDNVVVTASPISG